MQSFPKRRHQIRAERETTWATATKPEAGKGGGQGQHGDMWPPQEEIWCKDGLQNTKGEPAQVQDHQPRGTLSLLLAIKIGQAMRCTF